MADLTVTAAQVLPTSDTSLVYGIAGAAITAGQGVYLDTTGASPVWKLLDADLAAANASPPAIAMVSAASGQPVTVATGGSITIGAGAAPAVGAVYIASATAGGIAAVADLATNMKVIFIGVGKATNQIKLCLLNSTVTK